MRKQSVGKETFKVLFAGRFSQFGVITDCSFIKIKYEHK